MYFINNEMESKIENPTHAFREINFVLDNSHKNQE